MAKDEQIIKVYELEVNGKLLVIAAEREVVERLLRLFTLRERKS
jgi:hypothetical protein